MATVKWMIRRLRSRCFTKKSKAHPQLWKLYAQRTGIDPAAMAEGIRAEYEGEQTKAQELKKTPHLRKLPNYWSAYHRGRYDAAYEVDTGVPLEKLAEIADGLCRTPEGFHVHPKIVKLLEQRVEMGHGKRAVDYGFAEALAFGSLLLEGNPVRLTGQDTPARNFQPAACGAGRYRKRGRVSFARASRAGRTILRDRQFAAVRSGLRGFRIWFQPRLSGSAGGLGSAIRRFCEWRAGDHRSIHQRG